MRKGFCVQRIAILSVVLLLAFAVDGMAQTRDRNARSTTAQNREKFVISAKAGGINAVTGQASVHARGQSEWQQLMVTDDLDAGDRVRTSYDGRVEILLNPGSYLRVGADSEVELANNSLENLEVRLLRGTAIVEATGGNGIELNINISTPHAKLAIVRHGLYRLNVVPSNNTTELIVRKGRVLLGDSQTKVNAGNKVVFVGANFSVAKLTDEEKKKKNRDEMDLWSKDRAETLAKANRRITERMMTSAFASWTGFGRNGFRSGGFWFYNPRSFCYTFLPFGFGWGSPYGGGYSTSIWGNPRHYSRPTTGGWPSGGTTTGTTGSTGYPRPTTGTTPSVAMPKTSPRVPIDDVGNRPERKSMP